MCETEEEREARRDKEWQSLTSCPEWSWEVDSLIVVQNSLRETFSIARTRAWATGMRRRVRKCKCGKHWASEPTGQRFRNAYSWATHDA